MLAHNYPDRLGNFELVTIWLSIIALVISLNTTFSLGTTIKANVLKLLQLMRHYI